MDSTCTPKPGHVKEEGKIVDRNKSLTELRDRFQSSSKGSDLPLQSVLFPEGPTPPAHEPVKYRKRHKTLITIYNSISTLNITYLLNKNNIFWDLFPPGSS